MSPTFHGRDVFAPLALRLAGGEEAPGTVILGSSIVGADWPEDLPQIVYLDRYGNAMTGLRAATLEPGTRLEAGGGAQPAAPAPRPGAEFRPARSRPPTPSQLAELPHQRESYPSPEPLPRLEHP